MGSDRLTFQVTTPGKPLRVRVGASVYNGPDATRGRLFAVPHITQGLPSKHRRLHVRVCREAVNLALPGGI